MNLITRARIPLVSALSILAAAACAVALYANPGERLVSEKLYGLPGLENVGRLEEGLYRGAQPDPDGYITLKKMGIRTVISFRNNHDETDKVIAAGMNPVRVRMNMLKSVDPELIMRAVNLIADPELRPVYFHCALGKDRTGTVAAIYRIDKQGWPRDSAMDEMQDFGFNDIWTSYRKYVESYVPGSGEQH